MARGDSKSAGKAAAEQEAAKKTKGAETPKSPAKKVAAKKPEATKVAKKSAEVSAGPEAKASAKGKSAKKATAASGETASAKPSRTKAARKEVLHATGIAAAEMPAADAGQVAGSVDTQAAPPADTSGVPTERLVPPEIEKRLDKDIVRLAHDQQNALQTGVGFSPNETIALYKSLYGDAAAEALANELSEADIHQVLPDTAPAGFLINPGNILTRKLQPLRGGDATEVSAAGPLADALRKELAAKALGMDALGKTKEMLEQAIGTIDHQLTLDKEGNPNSALLVFNKDDKKNPIKIVLTVGDETFSAPLSPRGGAASKAIDDYKNTGVVSPTLEQFLLEPTISDLKDINQQKLKFQKETVKQLVQKAVTDILSNLEGPAVGGEDKAEILLDKGEDETGKGTIEDASTWLYHNIENVPLAVPTCRKRNESDGKATMIIQGETSGMNGNRITMRREYNTDDLAKLAGRNDARGMEYPELERLAKIQLVLDMAEKNPDFAGKIEAIMRKPLHRDEKQSGGARKDQQGPREEVGRPAEQHIPKDAVITSVNYDAVVYSERGINGMKRVTYQTSEGVKTLQYPFNIETPVDADIETAKKFFKLFQEQEEKLRASFVDHSDGVAGADARGIALTAGDKVLTLAYYSEGVSGGVGTRQYDPAWIRRNFPYLAKQMQGKMPREFDDDTKEQILAVLGNRLTQDLAIARAKNIGEKEEGMKFSGGAGARVDTAGTARAAGAEDGKEAKSENLAMLETKLRTANSRVRDLQESHDSVGSKIDVAEGQLVKAQSRGAKNSPIEKELAGLRSRFNKLTTELQSATAEREALRARVAQAKGEEYAPPPAKGAVGKTDVKEENLEDYEDEIGDFFDAGKKRIDRIPAGAFADTPEILQLDKEIEEQENLLSAQSKRVDDQLKLVQGIYKKRDAISKEMEALPPNDPSREDLLKKKKEIESRYNGARSVLSIENEKRHDAKMALEAKKKQQAVAIAEAQTKKTTGAKPKPPAKESDTRADQLKKLDAEITGLEEALDSLETGIAESEKRREDVVNESQEIDRRLEDPNLDDTTRVELEKRMDILLRQSIELFNNLAGEYDRREELTKELEEKRRLRPATGGEAPTGTAAGGAKQDAKTAVGGTAGAPAAGEAGVARVPSPFEVAKSEAAKKREALITRIDTAHDAMVVLYAEAQDWLVVLEGADKKDAEVKNAETVIEQGREKIENTIALIRGDAAKGKAKWVKSDATFVQLEHAAVTLEALKTSFEKAHATIKAKKEEVEKGSGGKTEKTPAEIDKEVRDDFAALHVKIKGWIPQVKKILSQARKISHYTTELQKLLTAAEEAQAHFQRLNTDFTRMLGQSRLFGKEWLGQAQIFENECSEEWENIHELEEYIKDADGKAAEDAVDEEQKAKDNAELQRLKEAYEKAKKEYKGWGGIKAIPLLKGIFDKSGEAKEKFEDAEKIYNEKLAEYTAKYIEQTLRYRISDVNESVEDLRDARKKNTYLQTLELYKKTGLIRLGASAALLGAGWFAGVETAGVEGIVLGQGFLRGTGTGFGSYFLMKGALRFFREKLGVLRSLTKKDIDRMVAKKDIEKLTTFLAAHELDAHERNIDIRTDGIYIALLEGLQSIKADSLKDSLEKRLKAIDEKGKGMRIANNVEKGILIGVSAVIGITTGAGLVFNGLRKIQDAKNLIEDIATRTANITTLQETANQGREAVAAAGVAAEETAKKAAQAAHLSAEKTTNLVQQAKEAAEQTAREGWKKAYSSRGLLIDQGIRDALPEEAKTAAQEVIDDAIKAAQQGGGAPAPETPAQLAARMKELAGQLTNTPDANKDSALQEALGKIIDERLKHGEGTQSILKVADEYTKIWTAHHASIERLASGIANNGGKLPATYKPTLEQFDALRKVASWHGTPLGHAAAEAVHLMDKDFLHGTGIEQIDITPGAPNTPHTLYEAFTAAENQIGVKSAAQIDKNYLAFLNEYLPDDKHLDASDLKAAKHIVHPGEHLWVSGKDIIMSQDSELLHTIDLDDLEPAETSTNTSPAAPAPEAPAGKPAAAAPVADTGKPRTPEGKAPAAKAPAPPKPEASASPAAISNAVVDAARVDATAGASPSVAAREALESKFGGVNITDLSPELRWLTDIKNVSELTDKNIASIQDHGREFAKLATSQLGGWYKIPPNSLEYFTNAIMDKQQGAKNIKTIFDALLSHARPLELLGKDGTTLTIEKK